MKGTKELTLELKTLMVMLRKRWMDLKVYMEEMELESEIWKVECCWNSTIRRIHVRQIHG